MTGPGGAASFAAEAACVSRLAERASDEGGLDSDDSQKTHVGRLRDLGFFFGFESSGKKYREQLETLLNSITEPLDRQARGADDTRNIQIVRRADVTALGNGERRHWHRSAGTRSNGDVERDKRTARECSVSNDESGHTTQREQANLETQALNSRRASQ